MRNLARLKEAAAERIDVLLLKRRPNAAERLALGSLELLRPELVAYRREKWAELIGRRRVSILAISDGFPSQFQILQCGDYWAKYELTRALGEAGYMATDQDPDVVIHLCGLPAELPPRAFKILWLYSHPDQATPELLSRYDRIFVPSRSYADKLAERGFKAVFAPGATSRTPLNTPRRYDAVFVGNVRGDDERRELIFYLAAKGVKLKVWGRGWESLLPAECYGGPYFDYLRLPELYASAGVSLNDHWADMRREGFVALRVFEILASGGFCLSDANTGLADVFDDAVPAFRSPEEAFEMIEYYLAHPKERRKKMLEGRKIALGYAWDDRVRQFMEGLPVEYAG